ncbi:BRO-N domain-containing protein [Gluconobacter albidus]|uniref:BRO-N domain-containing protein n=1 Tax=Gluconobacter albidus TaxID=318683 RepID=UPI001B8BEB76|nr:BRO family protein [Gluconobacter albidus]MBS1026775.1 hypothetical protein [Gluconobacter albidus]
MAIDRPFTNLEGEQKNIRTVTLEGAVWFVAGDLCALFGHYRDNASVMVRGLDKDQTMTVYRIPGHYDLLFPRGRGGAMQMLLVSESGLYKLIMRSDKPNARPFQDWVTKVVLPTIRKEGVYIRGEEKIAKASTLSELEDLQEQMLNLAGRAQCAWPLRSLCFPAAFEARRERKGPQFN